MKKMSIILLTQLLLFCYGEVFAETRGVTKDTIIMGFISADTGPIARDTATVAEAIRNYVRYINEQGGIHGRTIKLISEDTAVSIPRTMAASRV